MTRVVIDSMFLYDFVDSELKVETFHVNVSIKFHANFKEMSAFLFLFFKRQLSKVL